MTVQMDELITALVNMVKRNTKQVVWLVLKEDTKCESNNVIYHD